MTTIAQSVSVDYRALGPAAYALVGAMSATSYVLYTQVGLSQAGVIPLMRGTLAGKVNLSSAEKVKIWKEFYNSAKVSSEGPLGPKQSHSGTRAPLRVTSNHTEG